MVFVNNIVVPNPRMSKVIFQTKYNLYQNKLKFPFSTFLRLELFTRNYLQFLLELNDLNIESKNLFKTKSILFLTLN